MTEQVYLYVLTNPTYGLESHSKIGVSKNPRKRSQQCTGSYCTPFYLHKQYPMPDRETALYYEKLVCDTFTPIRGREYFVEDCRQLVDFIENSLGVKSV